MSDQSALYLPASAHDPGGKSRFKIPAGWIVSASFSGAGDCYRVSLLHRWSEGPLALWALMNPSTADHHFLDPTVAKTARVSRRLGFGGQFIANACSYRATDKMRLLAVDDPVGPDNHAAILAMAKQAGMIIIAHGRLPGDLQRHADAMCELLLADGHRLHVLRLTSDGVPVHPLARGKAHIPEDVAPRLWKMP